MANRRRSASVSSSDSDLETQLTGKASAMAVGTAARFVHAVYARMEIMAIREKFRCVGGTDCPMLTVVKACPEILRCQKGGKAGKTTTEVGTGSSEKGGKAGKKESGPRISLGRGGEGGLSLDHRFTLLRTHSAVPTVTSSPSNSRLPKGFEFRHVRFVDHSWL